MNAKTPQADKDALAKALHAVPGVESAILRPETSEIEIRSEGTMTPERDAISWAVSKVGFIVAAG
ncbi:MAG: hypothetical protein OEZ06_16805 [Myxococcales bacterium]|nr:hypothetical protein [Myxococcales bacterium]